MALNLKSVSKNRGNSQSNMSENVAVMITEIHVADPNKKVGNTAEDYGKGLLLEDGFGLTADYDGEGNPITEITFMLRPANKPQNGGKSRPEIFDFQPGRRTGTSDKMGQTSIAVLENAYMDNRTGRVMAKWVSFAVRDYGNADNDTISTDVIVSVDPVKSNEKTGRSWQTNYAVSPSEAVTFEGMDSFKEKAAKLLEGGFSAWVRVVNNASVTDPELATEIGLESIYPVWDKAKESHLSPADSVDHWLAKNEEWVEIILSSGTEEGKGYTFELVPFFTFSTGPTTLENNQKKGIDDSAVFRIPDEDRENGDAPLENRTTGAFTPGTIFLKRTGEDKGWFATRTFAKNRFGALYMRDEIPTANLPDDVRAKFESKAIARGAAKLNAIKARKSDQSPANDEDIPFGEPDHGGLSPS